MRTKFRKADVHNSASETRQSEGIHESTCGFNRLPELFRPDQGGRIDAMGTDGQEKCSNFRGEAWEEAWLCALITKSIMQIGSAPHRMKWAPSTPPALVYTARRGDAGKRTSSLRRGDTPDHKRSVLLTAPHQVEPVASRVGCA